MVLGELGQKLTQSLRKLNAKTIIDDDAIDDYLKEVAHALLLADVNVRLVSELRSRIRNKLRIEEALAAGTNRRKFIQRCVVDELAAMLTPDREPARMKKGQPHVVMFVGLQGSGKTTTCTKYAVHFQRKGWKVALVCADTFRAGAFDQLKQNATKVRIPFYGSYTETDPVAIAMEGVEVFKEEKYELIIVDTSGRHRQEAALFEEMKQIQDVIDPQNVVFVMDSHIGQACFDQAKAFADAVRVGSVIVTKLDGHAKGGGALSAVAATNSPIVFIGTGEHFDDFEKFEAQSFVSRLCGLGDLSGLATTLTEAMPLDKQPELIDRMAKGVFTLRDMYEQLSCVSKLGSLSTIMSMIPGAGAGGLPPGFEKQGVKRIKRFMVIMDSMTDDELDCKKNCALDKDIFRLFRVAKGSGTNPYAVMELLQEHKRFETMVSKMGKAGLMKDTSDVALHRNPKQVLHKLEHCMDPAMLRQMGGAENMLNLMKCMETAEGHSGEADDDHDDGDDAAGAEDAAAAGAAGAGGSSGGGKSKRGGGKKSKK